MEAFLLSPVSRQDIQKGAMTNVEKYLLVDFFDIALKYF